MVSSAKVFHRHASRQVWFFSFIPEKYFSCSFENTGWYFIGFQNDCISRFWNVETVFAAVSTSIRLLSSEIFSGNCCNPYNFHSYLQANWLYISRFVGNFRLDSIAEFFCRKYYKRQKLVKQMKGEQVTSDFTFYGSKDYFFIIFFTKEWSFPWKGADN